MKAILSFFILLVAVFIVEGSISSDRIRKLVSTGTNKPPIGRPDGHDLPDPILIGKPDGHDGPGSNLIGRPDGHDGPGSNLIGQQDGHDRPGSKFIGDDDGHEKWNVESSFDGDEPLVRCKRPLCDETLSCSIGPQTDVNGCAICQCLEDPCVQEKCETGYRCVPMECPNHGPCKKLQARCQKKKCDGPEPMCATYCPLGYKHNDRGCMTCECRDVQYLHNFTAEGVSTDTDDGDDDDDDDSSISDDDNYEYEDDSLIIEDLNYHLRKEAENHHGEDEDDDDEEGEMCEETRCRKNEICKSDWRYPGDSGSEKLNRICMIKTRCWAVANEPFLYPDHRNPDRRQSCDSSLTFEPLQCFGFNANAKDQRKTCWCTSDLGHVVEGTKTPIHAEEQKPICERNSTISATVAMIFEVVGRGAGDSTSVKVISEEVSKITFAPKSSIKMVDVSYPNPPWKNTKDGVVRAILTLNSHPDYDLPYALDLLFNIKDLQLTFDLYRVKLLEKPRVTSYLFSSPTVPPFIIDEDDTHLLDNFEPHQIQTLDAEHGNFLGKTLVIVCLTLLTILILIVLSIIALLTHRNCRRGQIRHHQLQNQISVAIDPENLLSDPLKNESVVLVTDDVLSKVKDSNVA